MEIPAPHFLLPLVAEFLSLHVGSQFCNVPSQLLTASLLLYKGWCYSSLWSLPDPQILADFWCVLISCLSKFTLTSVLWSIHREQGEGVWGWGAQSIRAQVYPWVSWQDTRGVHSHWLEGGRLDGVCDTVNRIWPLSCPLRDLSATLPAFPHHPIRHLTIY